MRNSIALLLQNAAKVWDKVFDPISLEAYLLRGYVEILTDLFYAYFGHGNVSHIKLR